MSHAYPPIGDYGLIGDCRSAALISRSGSLDWLCWPRFDSPSLFAALLDSKKGGRFAIRPAGEYRAERRYLPETNILETTFHTNGGSVALRDLMPVSSEENRQKELTAPHEVLREVEGLAGEVEIEVIYEPRPNYARVLPRLERRGALGIWLEYHPFALILRSEIPIEIAADRHSASGRATILAAERRSLSLTYAQEGPAVLPALGATTAARIARAAAWWRHWASQCTYEGPYRNMVLRSALVLKLLAYAPSGAIIAAPTTSLPEQIGGIRNWDYRYCWLRDASFTLRALLDIGFMEEASAFLSWILHATHLTRPELCVVYDVFGETDLPEKTLDHLEGFMGSSPVRIGNDAHHQLQLDVYGEVVAAAARYAHGEIQFDGDTIKLMKDIGETICRRWREPDEGIWEPRSGRAHHTHSKALCWVALGRLIAINEEEGLKIDVERFRKERDAIRAAIEERGYNRELETYTAIFDGTEVDASLLVLPLYGYISGDHPRMRSTLERIRARLGRGSLFYRYLQDVDDGLPPGEGAFGICSFWAVECAALGGDLAWAKQAFKELLTYANDLGLYAEEIDPESGAPLGNFPQGFSHVGLVNAALTLAECEAQHRMPAPTMTPQMLGVEQR